MAKTEPYAPDVVDFAYQVINMDRELQRLRAENADLLEYREKYVRLLNDGIESSQATIGGILQLVLVPGVSDAINKYREDPNDHRP